MSPALHHALLGLSVAALAGAALRAASRIVPGGLLRVIAAATLATVAAVAEALALGLAGLGGSTAALVLAAVATWAVAAALLPRPELSPLTELAAWWEARPLAERIALGAVLGAGVAWLAWQLRHPALGFDAVFYHLPEVVLFVQGGAPGSIQHVTPLLPVGNYPLTTEVTIAWATGIARSFVPALLVPWLAIALAAASMVAGLRALGATRIAAALAAAACCTSPWLLGWQSNGSVTDPVALGWLVACAALCAGAARGRPRLVGPAILAAGLAVGCKTTVLPLAALSLALTLWTLRRQLPRWPALAAAAAGALAVGGVWYVRNLVEHGSPFWPIVAAPWGDPVPPLVAVADTSFLDAPRATLDTLGHSYLAGVGGGVLLLAAGALAPLLAPRRSVAIAAAVVVLGALLWAASPVTGISLAHPLPGNAFSTTRYALPVMASACVALALAASAARGWRAAVALVVLAAAAVIDVVQTLDIGFPVVPAASTPIAGALVGGALAAAITVAGRARGRAKTGRRARLGRGRTVAAGGAAVGLALLLAVPAAGLVGRYGDTGYVVFAGVARQLAADPGFRDGSSPVATWPVFAAPLAGDSLRHRLRAIGASESCAALASRARHEWVVLYANGYGSAVARRIMRCLPRPAFVSGAVSAYRPAAP